MDNSAKIIFKRLVEAYKRYFNADDLRQAKYFFSPGRVNLIGEHTDYNGGHVFPFALEIGTYGIAVKRNDTKIVGVSLNFEKFGLSEGNIAKIKKSKNRYWMDYFIGVADEIIKDGHELKYGYNMIMFGNIPSGSGLSSSASIEILAGLIFSEFNQLGFENIEGRIKLAKICKRAENNFINVPCGIMDQFAIAMGKEDHAIYLDTNTLVYEYVPFQLENYALVIISTNKKRALANSEYGERRNACEEALKLINQNGIKCNSLGELNLNDIKIIESFLPPVLFKRAKHAISENVRTIQAKEAMFNHNLKLLGELMKQSHLSLKNDYEVTGVELDAIFEAAISFEGCVGARMTGAGFGGCAIALVEKNKIKDFAKQVGKIYYKKIGYNCDFYLSKANKGALKLN